MKFGKQMRLASNPKWQDDYFNYKKFKQLIKDLKSRQLALPEAQSEFLSEFDREYVKTENAHNRKILAVRRQLQDELVLLKGSVAATSSTTATESEDSHQSEPPSDLQHNQETFAQAERDIEQTCPVRLDKNPSHASSPPLPQPTSSSSSSASSSSATSSPSSSSGKRKSEVESSATKAERLKKKLRAEVEKAKEERKEQNEKKNAAGSAASRSTDPHAVDDKVDVGTRLVRLHRLAVSVRLFVELNVKAVDKICKKFDKQFLANIGPEIRKKLEGDNHVWVQRMTDIDTEIHKLLREFAPLERFPDADAQAEEQKQANQRIKADSEEDEEEEQSLGGGAGQGAEKVMLLNELDLSALPSNHVSHLRLIIMTNPLGQPISIPVIVAKGRYKGPVVGVLSAIHGNELNGIPLIWKLIRELDLKHMAGVLVACPVMNPEGFVRNQRDFSDGTDLNRVFPGKAKGDCSKVFVYQVLKKLVCKLEYVVDLHTASFGRANSLYVRADMNDRVSHVMALLSNPQIIVHNSSPQGSLRGACMSLGIPAVTVEIGDPQTFHKPFVGRALAGVENLFSYLKMLRTPLVKPPPHQTPIICSKSFWIFAQHGGILQVLPEVATWIKKGEIYATIRNVFGDIVHVYKSEYDGVIVGRNVNPVCMTGDRLIHLGIVGTEFSTNQQDGHK